ncbi:MAG: hypothetical protein R2909_18100 [Gemmatimonadales bacterium]
MRTITLFSSMLAVALLAPMPAEAQQYQHELGGTGKPGRYCMMTQAMSAMHGEGTGDHGDLMVPMRYQPRHLLEHASELGLSKEQRSRLQQLGHSAQMATRSTMSGRRLRELFSSETTPDSADLSDVADALAAVHAAMARNHLQAGVAARLLLTPRQPSAVAKLPGPCPVGDTGTPEDHQNRHVPPRSGALE